MSIDALEDPQFTKAKKSSDERIEIQIHHDDDRVFYIYDIVYIYWVPEGQTVSQHTTLKF